MSEILTFHVWGVFLIPKRRSPLTPLDLEYLKMYVFITFITFFLVTINSGATSAGGVSYYSACAKQVEHTKCHPQLGGISGNSGSLRNAPVEAKQGCKMLIGLFKLFSDGCRNCFHLKGTTRYWHFLHSGWNALIAHTHTHKKLGKWPFMRWKKEKKANSMINVSSFQKQINEIAPTYLATESYFQDSEPEQSWQNLGCHSYCSRGDPSVSLSPGGKGEALTEISKADWAAQRISS